MRIEDYAIIGDTQTMALVGRTGSIDWLCFPRFDSPACFASLLGAPENGRWLLAPRGPIRATRRQYRGSTLVLETELDCAEGTVRVIDFMPIRERSPDLVRIVEGVRGCVPMNLELVIRYDYGSVVPWVRRRDGRLHAVAGADALVLASDVETRGEGGTTVADFSVRPDERVAFTLTWHASYEDIAASPDPEVALRETCTWWEEWAGQYRGDDVYRDAVVRSLLTLKALTYAPSGGIVAAGTTSLPEDIGGIRNWDYRYCWLRDATFTLQALLHSGYSDEARAWREWLVRAVAGEPAKLQILYGITGERWVEERTLPWLAGYEGSRPVRIGNGAVGQVQLDVYGELMDALYVARTSGIDADDDSWSVQKACMDWLESHWDAPDEGIWEIRAERQQFTFSKVMAWTAFDRAAKCVEQLGLDGPVGRWRALGETIHAEVYARGFDRGRHTFTQVFGQHAVDASLLLLPIVGFLPGDDPRMLGTIAAIQRELVVDGFVRRYPTGEGRSIDGLTGGEGAFLACSFWLCDALVLADRRDEARALFERLLAIRNDVGLLSEEYDAGRRRLVGNFPQAFSHVALINSARNLSVDHGPARQRAKHA